MTENDEFLAVVASLYYEQNQNQQEIADRLEISRSTVSRLLKEARERGVVRIQVAKPDNRDLDLEQALIESFHLRDAYVLRVDLERVRRASEPSANGTPPPPRDGTELLLSVGKLAAGYLQRVLTQLPPDSQIGIAWGTGVYAAVNALPPDRSRRIHVTQLIGSLGSSDPVIDGPDLARLAAEKLGGRYHYLHAPVLLEQPTLREMLYREPAILEGLQRARTVALAITGIGTVREEASSFLRAGHLTAEELARLRDQGIVGETCGRFFDAWGDDKGCEINERVVGIDLDTLRRIPRVIAIARGLPKVQSILGALRGGYLTVLATDSVTAQAILDQDRLERATT